MSLENITNFFDRAIAPLKRKVLLMVGRSILTAVDDSKPIQLLQLKLLAGETKDEVERFQEFGLRSHPPANTEGILVCVGGNREHGVIIATENREAQAAVPALDEGDTVLYNNEGKFIHIKGTDIDALLSKLSIRNDSEELIEVLSDFMQEVIDQLNITAIGPQPLTGETITKMQAVKDRLDTFKV